MRIGTYARHNEQVEEAIGWGPDFIDLRMDLDHSLVFSDVKKMLNEAGIPCTVHLPSSPIWRPTDIWREIIPYMDIGVDMGAELVTFHGVLSPLFFSDDDIDAFLKSIPVACEAAAERGVTIAVETLGYSYPEMAILIDRCPKVRIAMDVGHGQIMAVRNRVFNVMNAFMDRVAMVNLHDNNGQEMLDRVAELRKKGQLTPEQRRDLALKYDEHMCIGEGSIDFLSIFKELKKRSYDGRFLLICKGTSRFEEQREKVRELWAKA